MYLEMARALAHRVMLEASSPAERVVAIYRHVVTRPPTHLETEKLLEYYARQLRRLREGELPAAEISQPVTEGRPPTRPSTDDHAAIMVEHAAWSMVARVVMNLDEAITKQ
jgi:hypothetical protein